MQGGEDRSEEKDIERVNEHSERGFRIAPAQRGRKRHKGDNDDQ